MRVNKMAKTKTLILGTFRRGDQFHTLIFFSYSNFLGRTSQKNHPVGVFFFKM